MYRYVIEQWVRAKVVRFSIARLQFSLLYLPHTFDSFYALPNQKYRPSSFSMEQPLHQNFHFHRKPRYRTKTRKPRTDIGKYGYSVLDNVGHLVREKRRFYRTCQISVGFDCRIWPSDRHTSRSLIAEYQHFCKNIMCVKLDSKCCVCPKMWMIKLFFDFKHKKHIFTSNFTWNKRKMYICIRVYICCVFTWPKIHICIKYMYVKAIIPPQAKILGMWLAKRNQILCCIRFPSFLIDGILF